MTFCMSKIVSWHSIKTYSSQKYYHSFQKRYRKFKIWKLKHHLYCHITECRTVKTTAAATTTADCWHGLCHQECDVSRWFPVPHVQPHPFPLSAEHTDHGPVLTSSLPQHHNPVATAKCSCGVCGGRHHRAAEPSHRSADEGSKNPHSAGQYLTWAPVT